MDWHSLKAEETLQKLNASKDGLTSEQASFRLKEFGPNALTERKKPPLWLVFLGQFNNFLVLLLIAAALVSAFLGEALDAAAIIVVVLLNAVFGFAQETRAEKAIEALQKLASLKATVLRDGKEHTVDSLQLVPGDVVDLPEGAKVPADCRLLEAFALQVDEAALTGESLPVDKQAAGVLAVSVALAERTNLVFLGTSISRGRARAVVVETGMKTELGKVAELVQSVEDSPTPLQVKLDELGKKLGLLAVAVSAIVFMAGFLRGMPAYDMLLVAISLAVAAVPEGLSAVVTITLAIGVQRMARRNSIIRKLPAVETLGSTNVICTDKTGTLTKNEMTVRHVFADGKVLDATGSGFSADGSLLYNTKPAAVTDALDKLLYCSVLCNSSSIAPEGIVGDPTEAALLVLAGKAGLDVEGVRSANPLLLEMPFSSERKMMSTVNRFAGKETVFTKGAPEVLVQRCSHVLGNNRHHVATPEAKKAILEQNEAFAKVGYRVLALAYKPKEGTLESGLTFLGLVAMNDPPRPEARAAIASAREAGIRVVMITGDNPLTAKSVAAELGMGAEHVLTGADVGKASDVELAKLVSKASVFARVSPEHKLRIVAAVKKSGAVVAVTGDGVNDAPAIKKGDIGVAMGITGTDVTKEASDMVITDDNFASIVAAVEEGRTIYDNIMKTVMYLVTCNFGEIATIFSAILLGLGAKFGIESPLVPIQILWMNLVTDGLPALALGMEPREPDVMARPPRRQNEPIFSSKRVFRALLAGVVMAIGTLGLFAYYLGSEPAKAITVAFSTLIFFQLFFAICSRSENNSVFRIGLLSNRFAWVAVFSAALLQLAVVQLGFAQEIFKTVSLGGGDWLLVLVVSSSVFLIVEGLKALRRW